MGWIFTGAYAPSTLRSFLRSFTFGHIRQPDAVASRFLLALAELAGLFTTVDNVKGVDSRQYALLDVEDTVIEVHDYAKQGAGFAYTRSAESRHCWPPCRPRAECR